MAIVDTPDGPVETDPALYAKHEAVWLAEWAAEAEARNEECRRAVPEAASRPTPPRPMRRQKRAAPEVEPAAPASGAWAGLDDLRHPDDR